MDARVLSTLQLTCCSFILGLSISCGQNGTASRLTTGKGGPTGFPTSSASISKLIGDLPLDSNPNVGVGVPSVSISPEVLISRKQYVISWNHQHRQPNYVAWRLSSADMGQVQRQNNFAVDPELERHLNQRGTGRAVQPEEYQGSCFDRGHLIPSADRTLSVSDNTQTFLMSNMMPQTANLNRISWQHLEHYARTLVRGTKDTLYIVAGPVFDKDPGHIGPDNDIDVPSHNFKIIIKTSKSGKPQVLASVLMPNVTSTGTDPVTDHEQACEDSHGFTESLTAENLESDWERFKTSLSAIEQSAGLDLAFLHQSN